MYDEKNKKRGVVLTLKDFELMIDDLEDLEDYEMIKKYGGKSVNGIPLEKVMEEIKRKQ